jgi:hypothetical protein
MLNVIFWVFISLGDSSEDFFASQRNDTLVVAIANDRIRFSRTSLAICKEAGVISLKGVIQYFLTLFLELDRLFKVCFFSYHILEHSILISVVGAWQTPHITITFHFIAIMTPVTVIKCEFFRSILSVLKFEVIYNYISWFFWNIERYNPRSTHKSL